MDAVNKVEAASPVESTADLTEVDAIPSIMNLDAAIDAGIPMDLHTTVVTLEFRSGEAVHLHPKIAPMMREGWMVKRAIPTVIDGCVKLLVTMRRRQRALS